MSFSINHKHVKFRKFHCFNSHCLRLLWHFPHLVNYIFKPSYVLKVFFYNLTIWWYCSELLWRMYQCFLHSCCFIFLFCSCLCVCLFFLVFCFAVISLFPSENHLKKKIQNEEIIILLKEIKNLTLLMMKPTWFHSCWN